MEGQKLAINSKLPIYIVHTNNKSIEPLSAVVALNSDLQQSLENNLSPPKVNHFNDKGSAKLTPSRIVLSKKQFQFSPNEYIMKKSDKLPY